MEAIRKLGYDIISYLSKFHLEGDRLKAQLVKKQWSVISDKTKRVLVTSVVWTVFLILSMFRPNYGVALSWLIMVTVWLCLTLVFYEMVYVHLENTKTWLWVSGLFLMSGWHFSFFCTSNLSWKNTTISPPDVHFLPFLPPLNIIQNVTHEYILLKYWHYRTIQRKM